MGSDLDLCENCEDPVAPDDQVLTTDEVVLCRGCYDVLKDDMLAESDMLAEEED